MLPSVLLAFPVLALLAAPPPARADEADDPGIATSSEATDAAPFAEVVGRNWAAWSGGRDAVVRNDLIGAISRPEFRGEDAAALAALERWMKHGGPVDRASAVGLEDPATLRHYRENVAKLRGARRVLFAEGAPSFARLQQGPAGDCYFFSGAGWIARQRPWVIRAAITPLPDGRYRVVFPNGDAAEVDPPTDGELAVNDSASTLQDGLWMPVLEKATGVIQSRRNAREAAVPDPTVSIDRGGGPKPIVERFTGRRASGHHLGARARTSDVRAALVRMQERRLMAEVLLLHRPPARLAWDHVYAVLGFEPSSDTVVVWNPWGTDFTPKGPSGPGNGYAREHGVFRIPLDEFVAFFTFLAIEEG